VSCDRPKIVWWKGDGPNPKTGKWAITFNAVEASKTRKDDPGFTVPCGYCIGCRLDRCREWAVRCVLESTEHEKNCFLTLTFDDEHLQKREFPESLDVKDVQGFMKRLRWHCDNGIFYGPDNSLFFARNRIRFFQSGEYGTQFGRPHYHVILFNMDFPDKYFFKYSPSGEKLYRSDFLERLWPFGHSSIGSLTFQSAQYVAKYITLKHTGKDVGLHYAWDLDIDEDTGELCVLSTLKPEFSTMSRRPGIGKLWYDKFKGDVYPHDYVVMNGKKVKPPKFYDSQFEYENPDDYLILKRNRKISAKEHVDNNTHERLMVREKVAKAKLQLKQRIVE